MGLLVSGIRIKIYPTDITDIPDQYVLYKINNLSKWKHQINILDIPKIKKAAHR